MNEELLITGKNNLHIDPELTLWGWPIAIYLFLGGLAAGVLIFSSMYHIRKKKVPKAVKIATVLVPVIIVVGLGLLFIDLHNKPLFWKLYTTIKWTSPMSWGAWTLLLITPISVLWGVAYFNELLPWFSGSWPILRRLERGVEKIRNILVWPQLILAVVLGVYTGVLLSAFTARPLWNHEILGVLFLVSGLSSAAALLQWLSKSKQDNHSFATIDLAFISVELLLLAYLLISLIVGTEVQAIAAGLLIDGSFSFFFWILVVLLGLLVPGVLEILALRGKKIPVYLVPVMVLIGGLLFRLIMLSAGQVSSFGLVAG